MVEHRLNGQALEVRDADVLDVGALDGSPAARCQVPAVPDGHGGDRRQVYLGLVRQEAVNLKQWVVIVAG